MPTVAARPQFNARVRPALREALETAARQNHRSVSEEAETRLEQSFLLEMVLQGHYPLVMAAAFEIAGRHAAAFEGHPEWIVTKEWQQDAVCYETALFEAVKAMWREHPTGTDVRESPREWCARLHSYLRGVFTPDATREELERLPVSDGDFIAGQRDREGMVQ
jgi:hypothetical protein